MFGLPQWVSLRQAEETRLWSELRRHEFLGTVCWSVTIQSEEECERRSRHIQNILKGPEPVTKKMRMLHSVFEVWSEFDKYVLQDQREATSDSGPAESQDAAVSHVRTPPTGSQQVLSRLGNISEYQAAAEA